MDNYERIARQILEMVATEDPDWGWYGDDHCIGRDVHLDAAELLRAEFEEAKTDTTSYLMASADDLRQRAEPFEVRTI